ncbi:hypothetical protein CSUI_009437 [Cystoisospora suis]|uniref:Uncharacterized protein n=1 Tax=Cystoisospora suis TaxID=483139 RepID=A0A2C6KK03_9APIC|nr:hypothetical protein CSUI_009437 [Cystoisospora suis]
MWSGDRQSCGCCMYLFHDEWKRDLSFLIEEILKKTLKEEKERNVEKHPKRKKERGMKQRRSKHEGGEISSTSEHAYYLERNPYIHSSSNRRRLSTSIDIQRDSLSLFLSFSLSCLNLSFFLAFSRKWKDPLTLLVWSSRTEREREKA